MRTVFPMPFCLLHFSVVQLTNGSHTFKAQGFKVSLATQIQGFSQPQNAFQKFEARESDPFPQISKICCKPQSKQTYMAAAEVHTLRCAFTRHAEPNSIYQSILFGGAQTPNKKHAAAARAPLRAHLRSTSNKGPKVARPGAACAESQGVRASRLKSSPPAKRCCWPAAPAAPGGNFPSLAFFRRLLGAPPAEGPAQSRGDRHPS